MSSGVNTVQILYIAFRLAPFIVVCYFALNSLMNFTVRGIIYLIGLLMLTFFTVSASGFMMNSEEIDTNSTCNIITLTGNMNKPLSNIPLSIVIYSYTLSYILTSVLLSLDKGSTMSLTNVPTIIFFSLLILTEFVTSALVSKCFGLTHGLVGLALGTVGGIMWGYFIYTNGTPDMTFYSTSADICTAPSTLLYQCTKSS